MSNYDWSGLSLSLKLTRCNIFREWLSQQHRVAKVTLDRYIDCQFVIAKKTEWDSSRRLSPLDRVEWIDSCTCWCPPKSSRTISVLHLTNSLPVILVSPWSSGGSSLKNNARFRSILKPYAHVRKRKITRCHAIVNDTLCWTCRLFEKNETAAY